MNELCFTPARELARRMATKELSAREVLEAHLAQIDRTNDAVNAIVTLVDDRAMSAALEADDRLARGETPPILHGLPVAHKDLVETKGIRTTMGSPIYADWVPDVDALLLERFRAAGAITIGKTNTPEFGAGSQTFNEVFGATRNPFDTSKTCGGSSGGAAVALACGMVPLADGSDTGGSLRNPASFCNVVGLRPSPGRVPSTTAASPWSPLSVDGAMGRTVDDVALALQALAGPDSRSPISIEESGDVFAGPIEGDLTGMRIAWSPDAGGLPVDRAVTAALANVPDVLSGLGADVVDSFPDLSDAREIFQVLRAWEFNMRLGDLYETRREDLKETIVWNIEEGRGRQLLDHVRASKLHAQLYARVHEFMADVDLLALPVSQVPPFDIETEWITEVDQTPMESYIDWMRSCSDITVTGHPALALPFAFTDDGVPVGLQLVGRHRGDRAVLDAASAVEAATRACDRRPSVASGS